ncbi:MAG: hypothetical protein ACRCYZ_05595 [Alphaproteobacteria bacterium]
MDALTLTPNIPLLAREQEIKIPVLVQNNKITSCGNSFLVSGEKSLQAKFSLIEILKKYRFLKKCDLLGLKKTILKIHGTYWASGDIFLVVGGYSFAGMRLENLHENPRVRLLRSASVRGSVYMKLLFEEGNWK